VRTGQSGWRFCRTTSPQLNSTVTKVRESSTFRIPLRVQQILENERQKQKQFSPPHLKSDDRQKSRDEGKRNKRRSHDLHHHDQKHVMVSSPRVERRSWRPDCDYFIRHALTHPHPPPRFFNRFPIPSDRSPEMTPKWGRQNEGGTRTEARTARTSTLDRSDRRDVDSFQEGGGSCDEFFVTKSILFSEHFRLKCIILLLLFSSMTENVLHVIYRPVFSALFLANEISDYCTICIIMTRSMWRYSDKAHEVLYEWQCVRGQTGHRIRMDDTGRGSRLVTFWPTKIVA